MDNGDAKKYIIGGEPQEDLLDPSSNWDNFVSYMMTVQNTIDLQEMEEEYDGTETICSNDDDILSAASSEPKKVPATEGKQKKKWSIFKKTKQINSIK